MTELSFAEAIAELVRQFPLLDPDDQELAIHQVRGLIAVADKKAPVQDSLSEEIEWFDNFPV